MIQTSLIVVTWNCKKYLRAFMESLEPSLKDPSTEILVIDNASSDGTPEFIKANFPSVTLICNEKNLGFAGANNIGLNRAKGEFVCLVNPDVKLRPDCLERMHGYMREHNDVGLLGPAMLGSDEQVARSTMRFPTAWNHFCQALGLDSLFPRSRFLGGYLMQDSDQDRTREVDVLNGWFLMTRRKALEQVGFLDERFFMYGEDIDWSKRYKDAGWKRVYFTDASAIHYGGGSSANAPIRFYIEQQRAFLQYFAKHHTRLNQVGFLGGLWVFHLARILGHGSRYLLPDSNQEKRGFKIKRSVASIRWLLGFTPSTESRN